MKDAVTSYARLISYKDTDGIIHEVSTNRFKLDLALQSFFSHQHVKMPVDPYTIERGQLCVYERDRVFFR